jgi:hypothetical protein
MALSVVRWESQVCEERPSWIKPVVAGSMPWTLRYSAAVCAPVQAVFGRHEQNRVDVEALVARVNVVRVSEFSEIWFVSNRAVITCRRRARESGSGQQRYAQKQDHTSHSDPLSYISAPTAHLPIKGVSALSTTGYDHLQRFCHLPGATRMGGMDPDSLPSRTVGR